MSAKFMLALLLLTITNCYFLDDSHHQNVAQIVEKFAQNLQGRFDTISFAELDWNTQMELAFNYWITAINIKNIDQGTIKWSTMTDQIVVSFPELTFEMVIEDKYTVPIKLMECSMIVNFYYDTHNLRVTDVKIYYSDIFLDINAAIAYVTKKLLSLDIVKDAILNAEVPLQHLLQKSVRDNWLIIKPLILSLQGTVVDTNKWVEIALKLNPNVQARGKTLWFGTKSLFHFESVKQNTQENSEL